MRNLKKVLAAVIIVTMILSTMMVSVFAEDEVVAEKTAAQKCEALGVLKGGTEGVDALYLATPTERIQAAILYLRLLGLEEEARAFDGTENFADASKVSGDAVNLLAYLYANPELGWSGDGKNFNPDDEVTAQQLYKVFLTILGYEQGADFDYAETLFFAKFVGMSDISDKIQVTNADLATGLVEVLGCVLKGGGPADTLIAQLVNGGKISEEVAIANGFEVTVLKIASVAAPAAKEVAYGTADPSLPATATATMTDGTTVSVDVTWDMAGYDSKKVGKVTLKGTIEGFADGVSIDVTVKTLVLDVATVEIINGKQMVVTYNGPVAGDAVKDKAKYKINGNVVTDASLSEDTTTVTLTTTYANRMGNYSTNNKLEISKDVGMAADKTIENLICRDTTVPTFVSATPTGPRGLKVVFSEPLNETVTASNTVAAFTLDDGKIGLDASAATYNATGTEITLKTLTDLTEGTHTIKVSGSNLTDGVGYSVAGNTVSFDYTKDVSPVTVSVKSQTENSVTLKFNKDVVNVKDVNVQFSHTYKGFGVKLGNDAAVVADSASEYTITFSANPFPPGATNLYIAYVSSTGTKIKDGWGNEFAEATVALNTSADTTAPTVSAEFTDATHIKVTFSEDVQDTATYTAANAGDAAANYSLKSGSDTITVNAAVFDGTSKKVVNLTTNTINGGSLTLVVKNVKDKSIAANKMADTTLTIAATDKVAPALDGTTPIAQISATKVKVNYSEAMDVATITDKGNYKINGVALVDGDKIEAVNSNKSVVITFATAPTVGWNLTVGRVKDAAGNYATWLSTTIGAISGSFTTIAADTFEMVGASKVKLTIKDQLTSTGTVADYVYSLDDVTYYPVSGIASVTVDAANNKTYIELIIGADIGNDTDLTNPVYIATANGVPGTHGTASDNVKNALGQTFAMNDLVVTDKVAPKYIDADVLVGGDAASFDGHASSIDGTKLKYLRVEFSENLYVASVTESDFTVEGFTVSAVKVVNNYVYITLADKDNSSGELPKVKLVGTVEDTGRTASTENNEITLH